MAADQPKNKTRARGSSKNALFAATSNGIPSSQDLVKAALEEALKGINDQKGYIQENFSALIHGLQNDAYKLYLNHERNSGGRALRRAMEQIAGPTPNAEAVLNALQSNFGLLDKYFLSLTQSRRSRAGTSFQLVMTALLDRLGYNFEEQPILPDSKPDYVLPSRNWYLKNGSDCIILTLKRTLRERWRQVPTEGNTGSTFFLATIDPKVPVDELEKMKTLNVKLIVPIEFKKNKYQRAMNVISFEDFFEDFLDPAVKRWKKIGAV